MIFTMSGAAMIAATSMSYWRLLPRGGREHPLVTNSDIGSMITIGLMTAMTIGIGLLCQGLFG